MAAPATKAIIFDCFGVLYLDTKKSLISVIPKERHQEVADIFASNNYGFFNRHEYLDRLSEASGLSVDAIVSYIASEHHLNDELVRVIQEKIKPHYKVGLLSNIGREWIEDFFTKHQLHDLFDEVVLSGDEGMTKPAIEIFELMASRLGLDATECVMIDDIARNCEGAELAGMQAVRFDSNDQLFDELDRLQLLSQISD